MNECAIPVPLFIDTTDRRERADNRNEIGGEQLFARCGESRAPILSGGRRNLTCVYFLAGRTFKSGRTDRPAPP